MTSLFAHRLHDLDLTCNGSVTAMLDEIDKNGIAQEDGRAFATWLYARLSEADELRDELREARTVTGDDWETKYNEIKADFEAYCDANPAQAVEPEVHAGQLYLPNEPVARTRAARLAADPRVRETAVQFEPNNGWVVVVYPNLADLREFAGEAEIRDGVKREVQGRKPVTSPQAISQGATGGGDKGQAPDAPKAPVKGATKRVWDIADGVYRDVGLNRAQIIAACEAAGINKATAATQYSKWKKARGY